jgi:alpha-tubulin suppressor-like RCC1 family protein
MHPRALHTIAALAILLSACGEEESKCATNADCFKGEACDPRTRLCGAPAADMAPDLATEDMVDMSEPDLVAPMDMEVMLLAPQGLKIVATAERTLMLSWEPVAGAIRYEVKYAEPGAPWQDAGNNTSFEDLLPPSPMLKINSFTASSDVFAHVALNVDAGVTTTSRRYLVRAVGAADKISPDSAPITGELPAPTAQQLSFTWQVGPDASSLTALTGASGVTHIDTAAAEAGTTRLYRVTVSAPNIPSASADVVGQRKRPRAIALGVGAQHTCALLETKRVRCWGVASRLGQGTNGTLIHDPSTLGDIPLGGPAKAISVSTFHTCALMESGDVRCWGTQDGLRLGAMQSSAQAVVGDAPGEQATLVPLPEPSIAISTAVTYSCAIGVSGKLSCWGTNANGALGNRLLAAGSYAPTEVNLTRDGSPFIAQRISLFANHACATGLQDNLRTSFCWGKNTNGQLGTNNLLNYGAPSVIDWPPPPIAPSSEILNNPIEVHVGELHSCGRQPSHKVQCWGAGSSGRLGRPSGDIRDVTGLPLIRFSGTTQISALSVGAEHSCAITVGDGKVRCWGSGAGGVLGTGTTANWGDDQAEATADMPAVPLGVGAVAVAAGKEHTCAILDDGDVRCWGNNSFGQLGLDPNVAPMLGHDPARLPDQASYNVQLLKR